MSAIREPKTAKTVSGLMTFLLICLFAGLSLLLVVIGAGVYKSVAETSANNNAVRATVSYVSGKIRACGEAGNIRVTDLEGQRALAITADYDGEAFTTYVYCMGGALRELFVGEESELTAADGARLADITYFSPSIDNGLCTFTMIDAAGNAHTQRVALRSEAAP